MKPARWYFDFISPFAYLQWLRLPALGDRLAIEPVPILFAALLEHHGHKGPAEIATKRQFTYRFVLWQARRLGLPLRFPPAHPFNPLPVLRLALAAGNTREAIGAIFDHLWVDGRAGDSAESLAPLARRLGVDDVAAALARADVKAQLRANTDAAIAAGVFGVPTLAVGGRLFWGADATPMVEDWLADPGRFDDAEMRRIDDLPAAAVRR
jgi:2-hydroxychromene-2-carboxylate isomerase